VKNANYLKLWKMEYLDRQDDGNRVNMLFENIPTKEFDDEVPVRLFACIGTYNFFKNFVNSIIFQNGYVSYGRTEMYLCITPAAYLV
jgi:hypothetical protein